MKKEINEAIREMTDIAGHWTRMSPPNGNHEEDCWMYHAACALVRVTDIAIEALYKGQADE